VNVLRVYPVLHEYNQSSTPSLAQTCMCKNFTLVTDQTISLFIALQIFKGSASLTSEICVSMSGLKYQASGSNLGDKTGRLGALKCLTSGTME